MIAVAALLVVGLVAFALVGAAVYLLPRILDRHQEERQRLYVAAERGFAPAFTPEADQQVHVPTIAELDEWWAKQPGSEIPVPDDLADLPPQE